MNKSDINGEFNELIEEAFKQLTWCKIFGVEEYLIFGNGKSSAFKNKNQMILNLENTFLKDSFYVPDLTIVPNVSTNAMQNMIENITDMKENRIKNSAFFDNIDYDNIRDLTGRSRTDAKMERITVKTGTRLNDLSRYVGLIDEVIVRDGTLKTLKNIPLNIKLLDITGCPINYVSPDVLERIKNKSIEIIGLPKKIRDVYTGKNVYTYSLNRVCETTHNNGTPDSNTSIYKCEFCNRWFRTRVRGAVRRVGCGCLTKVDIKKTKLGLKYLLLKIWIASTENDMVDYWYDNPVDFINFIMKKGFDGRRKIHVINEDVSKLRKGNIVNFNEE